MRVVLVVFFTAFLAGAINAQTVKPAFPDGVLTAPSTSRQVLKRPIRLGDDLIAVCDAVADPTVHQNCYIRPGHTVDELLDAVKEEEQAAVTPCRGPHMNTTAYAKRKGRF